MANSSHPDESGSADGILVVRGAAVPQLARFLVVGVGNTVVSFVAYRLLLAVGAPYAAAAPAAFAVGALNGYIFNRRWTFAARDTLRARVLYVGFQVVGAVATSVLVVAFVDGLGMGRTWAYLASIPPVTVGLFLANRFWVFGDDAPGRMIG